jgi:hypothetical protein
MGWQCTAVSSSGVLRCCRRAFHCSFHEPITPELIVIESIEETSSASEANMFGMPSPSGWQSSHNTDEQTSVENDANNHNAQPLGFRQPPPSTPVGKGSGVSSSSASSLSSSYTNVTTIDAFAKGKVVNFLRRMGVKDVTIFHVVEEKEARAGLEQQLQQKQQRIVFRARAKLTLPSPHDGMYVAEGVGETAKDAESLAAMHAQYIIDALGIQLFRLASPQIKHAEAARKAGRYAPLPNEPMKPVGTEVPGACRMTTLAASVATAADHDNNNSGAAATTMGTLRSSQENSAATHLFRRHVMEAELVSPPAGGDGNFGDGVSATRKSSQGNPAAQEEGCLPDATRTEATSAGGQVPSDMTSLEFSSSAAAASIGSERHPYSGTCWLPWTHIHQHHQNVPAAAVGGTAQAVIFDPTENGSFQMVNVMSTRMSPSKDALLFPSVYDKLAYERLKDYFFGHGLDIKKQFHLAHVTVSGYSVRMYVAECKLIDVPAGIIARGKAQDRDCAIFLAAMHAELLLDALGRRLFPTDDVRQGLHAAAVKGFGRWALDPTLPCELQRPPASLPLPLPLKQQVGGDDMWLDPNVIRRQRTFGDRVLVSLNELNLRINEMVEVNPPQSLLTEAQILLRE